MLIIGVDPGSSTTACGVIETNTKHIEFEVLKLKRNLNEVEKIMNVFEFIKNTIENYNPEEFAIETPFYSVNIKTAMILTQIKTAAIIAARLLNIPVYQYTPRQIKQAICGYGAADKKQIKFVVEKTLKIDLSSQPYDVSDAIAVALTHIYVRGL